MVRGGPFERSKISKLEKCPAYYCHRVDNFRLNFNLSHSPHEHRNNYFKRKFPCSQLNKYHKFVKLLCRLIKWFNYNQINQYFIVPVQRCYWDVHVFLRQVWDECRYQKPCQRRHRNSGSSSWFCHPHPSN